mmetsp:Transcript_18183/g.40364  ORF Transcript_18183/g.40364 Transcript_18183/m.40364 type:complete len:240 (+) Transcript_18183:173-892(+)
MFSRMTVSPCWMASTILDIHSFSPCLRITTWRPFFPQRISSYLFSQRMPCSWGSISNGQRLQLVMMAPFSREMRSAGRPSFCHTAICESFVSTCMGSTLAVSGMSRPMRSCTHTVFQRFRRNSAPKAPMYEVKAAASMTSPARVSSCERRPSTVRPQRSFSEARPLVRRSARDRRSRHSLASCSTRAFSCVAAMNSPCRVESFASMAVSTACTTSRSSSALRLARVAMSSDSMRGFTRL